MATQQSNLTIFTKILNSNFKGNRKDVSPLTTNWMLIHNFGKHYVLHGEEVLHVLDAALSIQLRICKAHSEYQSLWPILSMQYEYNRKNALSTSEITRQIKQSSMNLLLPPSQPQIRSYTVSQGFILSQWKLSLPISTGTELDRVKKTSTLWCKGKAWELFWDLVLKLSLTITSGGFCVSILQSL